MTPERGPLTDATIEASLARRAPRHADPRLLADVLAAAAATRQVRRWTPRRLGRDRRLFPVLAVAAIVGGTLLAALAGSSGPNRTPAPSVIARASTDVTTEPSASTSVDCATDTASILLGSAMPPTASAPMALPFGRDAGGALTGVYVTRRDNEPYPNVWAVLPGAKAATRIATVSGNQWISASVTDVSANGRLALLEVGEFHGGVPRPDCEDIYAIHTDGSSATRLTFNRGYGNATNAHFSFDGQWVAYQTDTAGHDATLGIIDLAHTAPSTTTDCFGGSQSFALAWSRVADRLVALCGGQLETFVEGQVSGSVDLPYNAEDEVTILLGWQDDSRILLATAVGGTSLNAPVNVRTFVRRDAPGGELQGTWTDAVRVRPLLGQSLAGGAVAPNRIRFVVSLTSGTSDGEGWYLIDDGTGQATKVSGLADNAAWSSDGRYVLLDEWGAESQTLMLHDVMNGSVQSLGTLPSDNARGIWRLP
ncbi:MAG: hypothetical protein QOI92_1629 [Chloroflexota bacterium]|nr:hypothetical protein [Chloroflexota bacterium]